MLGILKVKMSLEYPTFETAFESGLGPCDYACLSDSAVPQCAPCPVLAGKTMWVGVYTEA